MKRKNTFGLIRIALYIAALTVIILASVGKIDIKCFWKENYGFDCPSCGITRASKCVLTLKFKDAYNYNSFFSAVLVPFNLVLLIDDLFVIIKRFITKKDSLSLIEILLGYGDKDYDKDNSNC